MKRQATAANAPVGIAVRGLSKRYDDWTALDDVDFAVEPGTALGLWGPNGAGKTTIVRCLLGLARFSGEVRVGGLDPARQGREVRRLVGYVPQELPVAPVTVAEMAAFIAGSRGVTGTTRAPSWSASA